MTTPITQQISIGNSTDSRTATTDNFDIALNVAIDLNIEDDNENDVYRSIRPKRHKIGLYDGPGNDPLIFASALVLLHSLIKSNRKVLVHCQAGVSRSVMVVAAYLDLSGQLSLDDALEKILPLRGTAIHRQSLYDLAKIAIPLAKKIIDN